MNENPDDHDELVSADIDGETSPDEHARVMADPQLRARRDELAAVADRGATPPDGPTGEGRATALAAALEAFDEVRDEGDAVGTKVVPISRRRKARWISIAAGAAAAVLVVAVLALANRDTTTTDTAAKQTAAPAATSTTLAVSSGEAAGAVGTAGAADTAAATTVAPQAAAGFAATLPDLGTFASADDLRTSLRSRLLAAPPAPIAVPPDAPCGPPAALSAVDLLGRIVLVDRTLVVYVGPLASTGAIAAVGLDEACNTVFGPVLL